MTSFWPQALSSPSSSTTPVTSPEPAAAMNNNLTVNYNASLEERKKVYAQRTSPARSPCPSPTPNSLNPFAGQWDKVLDRSPSPSRRGEAGYGRPEPGSLTEQRGIKAHQYINKEVESMCEIIRKYGIELPDGYLITFKNLFQVINCNQ